MADLQNKLLFVLKGLLFLVILGLSSALVRPPAPGWRTALLLGLVIWSASRLYYFLFIVLERHVDPRLEYAGLCARNSELWRRWVRGST